MHTGMRGGPFTFMTKGSTAIFHPIAFGCHRTCGNECQLHSHLDKCFSGNWLINKCSHLCFEQQFTWVTDCHAIKFILSYEGKNPALLWLQMQFMCWDMDIEHRNDMYLADANYFFCLGSDLCYDPFLREYIERVWAICHIHPPPISLPIEPQNMPYYQGPWLPQMPPTTTAFMSADVPIKKGFQHLTYWPVSFGFSSQSLTSDHSI